jgi:hypothetical protein
VLLLREIIQLDHPRGQVEWRQSRVKRAVVAGYNVSVLRHAHLIDYEGQIAAPRDHLISGFFLRARYSAIISNDANGKSTALATGTRPHSDQDLCEKNEGSCDRNG